MTSREKQHVALSSQQALIGQERRRALSQVQNKRWMVVLGPDQQLLRAPSLFTTLGTLATTLHE